MGLLSGKFDRASLLPEDDVRGSGHDWVAYFSDRRPRRQFLDALASIHESLTSGGRTLVQGALGWIWAAAREPSRSPDSRLALRFRRTPGPWSSARSRPRRWPKSTACSTYPHRELSQAPIRSASSGSPPMVGTTGYWCTSQAGSVALADRSGCQPDFLTASPGSCEPGR
jgi:hypothetical protein